MAKLVNIPAELTKLLPENCACIVVVGNKAFEMYPLPEGKIEKLSKHISSLLAAFTEFAKESKTEEEKAKKKSLLETFFTPEATPAIISEVLDLPLNEAQDITIPQLQHFVSCLYDQNFSGLGVPETSSKNLDTLLVKMGLKKAPRAARWEEAVLRIAAQIKATDGDLVEKADLLLRLREALTPEQYTIFFQPSTDGAKSTSSENESASAPSLVKDATPNTGTKSIFSSKPSKVAAPPEVVEAYRKKHSGGATAPLVLDKLSPDTAS